MTDIISQVATYLAGKGHGTVGSSIFLDELHDSPAHQIAIFTSGGRTIQTVDGHTSITFFDIHIRNSSKSTARSKALDIRDSLGSAVGVAGAQHIKLCPPVLEYFGKDASGRHRYGVFFEAME